jgi:hypothetical protein
MSSDDGASPCRGDHLRERTVTSSTGAATLSHFLPREAWWLIFISRTDHAKALAHNTKNPADHYDNDKSPGYRAGIETAFEQLFENTGPLERIDSSFYRSLHDLAISMLTGDTDGELYEEWSTGDRDEGVSRGQKSAGSVRFPMAHPRGSRTIAADLATERLVLRTGQTVHILTEPDEKNLDAAQAMFASVTGEAEHLYACLYNVDPGMISVNYRRAMAPRLVDAVGERYAEQIHTARSAGERLAAITRLIRTLHVLHLFTNANGRLNITLLFTKLLLDQGFGPVCLTNQDDLFSGSYTVDEMVTEVLREIEAFPGIARDELDRQERDGKVPPVSHSAPKAKVTAVRRKSQPCLVQ